MENATYSGKFRILPGIDAAGSLTIAGSNSSLHVWGEDFVPEASINDGGLTVIGDLHDLRKVSLIGCWPSDGMQHSTRNESKETWHCTLHPMLIVIGHEYLLLNDKEIVETNFTFDDAATLFYDRNAFGIVNPYKDESGALLIEKIGKLEDKRIELGPRPIIAYFNGRFDIISINTAIGNISVSRGINYGFGNPDGIRINNEITIKLKFPESVDSDYAVRSVIKLLRLFEVIIGRPQNITKLSFFKGEEEQRAEALLKNFPRLPNGRAF